MFYFSLMVITALSLLRSLFKTYKSLAYQKSIWKYEEADLQSIKGKLDYVDWFFYQ